jgi:glutaminyl-tRNA synthetase
LLARASVGERFQLERVGFFVVDEDTRPGAIVLNRTVALKDSWQKTAKAPVSAKPKTEAPATAPRPLDLSPEAIALRDAHGLSAETARVLAMTPNLRALFAPGPHAKIAATLLVNDVLGELRSRKIESAPFDAAAVTELASIVASGAISATQTKEVLAEMFASGKAPKAIVAERGIEQIASADALLPVIQVVLEENADAVARYRGGNKNVFGAIVGMIMKKTGGKANPKTLKELLQKKLDVT